MLGIVVIDGKEATMSNSTLRRQAIVTKVKAIKKITDVRLSIEYMPIGVLTGYERQLREHPARKFDDIAASIAEFGFINPVTIDAKNGIVCGELRVAAAHLLGLQSVPCVRVAHLSKAQLKALRIADNRLAEGSEWIKVNLGLEIRDIDLLEPGFNKDLLGFEAPELDLIVNPEPVGAATDPSDHDGIVPAALAVSRLGDVWLMALHSLGCGNGTMHVPLARQMGGKKARVYAGDPPYGIKVAKIGGKGRIKHREFVQGSGEQTQDEYHGFLRRSMAVAKANLQPGGLAYFWSDWRQTHTTVNAGLECGLSLVNICVWAKTTPGMGSFYRSQTEMCVVFQVPGAPHVNNIQLGKFGRNRSNVWFAPGLNTFSRERMELLSLHPTVKSCQLIEGIIKDASNRGDLVIDTFCGSGTTLIAAQKTGRIARCLELDPLYVDVAIQRFERRFGIEAIHAVTGRTFKEEAAYRAANARSDALPRPVRKPPAIQHALSGKRVGGVHGR